MTSPYAFTCSDIWTGQEYWEEWELFTEVAPADKGVTAEWRPARTSTGNDGKAYADLVITVSVAAVAGIYTVTNKSRAFNHCATGEFDEWTQEVQVAPKITGAPSMYWIGGEDPPEYFTQRVLRSTLGGPDYTWTVTQGQTKASFSIAGLTSTRTTSENKVGIYAREGSRTLRDISITVTTNGVTSDAFTMTVRSPVKLSLAGSPEDVQPAEMSQHEACPDCVWLTVIPYNMTDQFNLMLPYNTQAHERWTTDVPPPTTTRNWTRPPANGLWPPYEYYNPDGGLIDRIGVRYESWLKPQPSPIQNPPSTKVIDSWDGEIYVGSGLDGHGCRAQTNTWRRWLDHARHIRRVTPAPIPNCPYFPQ